MRDEGNEGNEAAPAAGMGKRMDERTCHADLSRRCFSAGGRRDEGWEGGLAEFRI